MSAADLPHAGVLTRLGPSEIHGVGVFAICPIPKGTQVFPRDQAPIRWIDAAAIDVTTLGPAERQLYRDFAIRRDGMLGCPASFDVLTPGWYVNEPRQGEAANLRATADFRLIAVRDVVAGRELTLSYAAFNTGPGWQ